MATLAQRFYGPAVAAAGGDIIATVPAGRLWLVRNVSAVNNAAGSSSVLDLRLNGTTTSNRLYYATIAATSSLLLDPWWALEAGDVLRVYGAITQVALSLGGYDLAA